ncbi:DUF756 domain-containing protein, partial [bacterium]
AWYGAWYVSEVMNILTEDHEVWRKTVFILCYDENDGYFDHMPPFVAPFPGRPETGKVSEGIDTTIEVANAHGREHSIGLGYRCPLVVASPWSRGGCVNSQVFDHTSILRFLETWTAARGRPVREENISDWRRTVCGDLTSTFRPYNGEAIPLPKPLDRDATVRSIHQARFKALPKGGKALSPEEIRATDVGQGQEPGTRPSCPLPYELAVNAVRDGDRLTVRMAAERARLGAQAQGAPFNAYAYGDEMICRSYAVRAGDAIADDFAVGETYHVRIDGPNGFMREFRGSRTSPSVEISVAESKSGLRATVTNRSDRSQTVELRDESYGAKPQRRTLPAGAETTLAVATASVVSAPA